MAKRLQIAPEAQAALDELTRAYGGTLPARLSIFWLRQPSEGGSVQIADPSSPTGQFELPVNDLAEGRLEPWVLSHPALGGARSYRLLVFLPKPDGTYPPKPQRSINLSYVDPAENQAAVEASRAAQAAATMAAASVAADAVMDAAQGAVAAVASKSPPDVADKLQESLSQFSNVMGSVMSTVNRFQTPLPQQPVQQPAMPGVTYYPPMAPPYAPPPYGYFPGGMQPPAPGPDTKLADALVSLVTAKQAPAPTPQTDPAILAMLQQQGQLLAKIAENMTAPKVAAGPSPEMAALMARVDAAERAGAEARAQLAQQQLRAEAEREKLELRQQLAELKSRIEGGSGRPDPALEFAKIQMQQQGENARMFQAMLERSQQQANEFNRELRELMNAPGPDQGAQFKQLASAMGEINNTAMSMMSSMMRMGLGGGGGEGNKKPAWAEPAERMIGILAGLGQSIMSSTTNVGGEPEPEPPPEPQQLRVAAERPPRPALAPAPESPQLAAPSAPEPQAAASQPPTPAAPPAPRGPPPAEDFVGRARQLAQGSDFIGAIRTLRAAFRYYPDLVRNGDEIRTVATLLDGIEWPINTTAEAIEGAYVAVYGEPVREHLQRLVTEERAKATQPLENEPQTTGQDEVEDNQEAVNE